MISPMCPRSAVEVDPSQMPTEVDDENPHSLSPSRAQTPAFEEAHFHHVKPQCHSFSH